MSKETKTLAIRLEPELHARLSILARLAAMSVVDLVRWAIEDKVKQLADDPQIKDRADDLQEAMELDLRQQRDALSSLFADNASSATKAASSTKTTKPTRP